MLVSFIRDLLIVVWFLACQINDYQRYSVHGYIDDCLLVVVHNSVLNYISDSGLKLLKNIHQLIKHRVNMWKSYLCESRKDSNNRTNQTLEPKIFGFLGLGLAQ